MALQNSLSHEHANDFVLYYAPATLANLPTFTDPELEVSAIAAVFRLFARAFNGGDPTDYRGVDLRFAADTVKSEVFKDNPGLLDSISPLENCYIYKQSTGRRRRRVEILLKARSLCQIIL